MKLLSNLIALSILVTVCQSAWSDTVPSPEEILSDNSDLHRSPDAKVFRTGPSSYRLESGHVIFHPLAPGAVETNLCTINVHPHAAVLISTEPTVTRVIDLFDSHFGCIKVRIGQAQKRIGPGGEIAVADTFSKGEAQRLLLQDNLRRRKLRSEELCQGKILIQDQVSILDASLKEPMLGTMRHSAKHDEKSISDKILKTAAALSLTESSEPYTVHQE